MLACFPTPTVVRGTVIPGDQRGRTIGFPTANIALTDAHADLRNGVYAGYADAHGRRWPAAVNIGTRPTIGDDGPRLLEAHLIDFQGDLYGTELVVELVARLRDERRFDSLPALVEQLRSDVIAARQLLD